MDDSPWNWSFIVENIGMALRALTEWVETSAHLVDDPLYTPYRLAAEAFDVTATPNTEHHSQPPTSRNRNALRLKGGG